VPKYINAIPPDPYRKDRGPLGYVVLRGALPDGGDRPLVYFEAGEPDEGVIDTEPMISWQQDPRGSNRRQIRQYRDMSLWVPKVRRFDQHQKESQEYQKAVGGYGASAAETVDGDPNEPDTPGDDSEKDDAADGPPGD
jgi:hypothetical protein